MQIVPLNNLNFGRITISPKSRNEIYYAVKDSHESADYYKEIILDMLDIQNSEANHVRIDKHQNVIADSEWTGGASLAFGPTFLEQFATALRSARSEGHENFLTASKERIDV